MSRNLGAESDIRNRELWLQSRKKGIGGSEAGIILGVSSWKTRVQLWQIKRGELKDDEQGEWMEWGLKLEPLIAKEYTERTGFRVQKRFQIQQHKHIPWMICSLDRKVVGEPGILEIKCINSFQFNSAEWGADGSNKVPRTYYAQAQHNMAVMGAQWCDMPALIGGMEYRCYHIVRDDNFIKMLIEQEAAFIEAVKTGNAPEPVNVDDLKLLFPKSIIGKSADCPDELLPEVFRLNRVKKTISENEKIKDAIEYQIKAIMKDAEVFTYDSEELASWKTSEGGKRTFRLNSRYLTQADSANVDNPDTARSETESAPI